MADFPFVSVHRTRTLKASYLLVQNIQSLLAARGIDGKALATFVGHQPAWLSKILSGDRGINLSDLDRTADFFGLTTAQLLTHGISPLTERRRAERRSDRDRRTGGDRRQASPERELHPDVSGVRFRPKPPTAHDRRRKSRREETDGADHRVEVPRPPKRA